MGINKDQVAGRAEEAQGKVKEVVGRVIGNRELENKGEREKNRGATEALVGDLKETVRNPVNKI